MLREGGYVPAFIKACSERGLELGSREDLAAALEGVAQIMGDRTNVELIVARRDRAAVVAEFGESDEGNWENDEDPVVLVFYDMNGGGYNQLCDLADKHIPFYGNHGDGGQYAAHQFASLGEGDYNENPCAPGAGELVVILPRDRSQVVAAVAAAYEFGALYDRAVQLVKKRAEEKA